MTDNKGALSVVFQDGLGVSPGVREAWQAQSTETDLVTQKG